MRTLVAQLRASGVAHAVVAPGSRSTPLALGIARARGITAWLQLDERSAGYFALGLARQLRAPVALVCTSGTAAANFAPAVIEAFLSRVPLVVLTADRPPELRDVGANQTIDQRALYGTHVKWAIELPLPDAAPAVQRQAGAAAARAVAIAVTAPAGPVHLNLPFREPLIEASSARLPGADEPAPVVVAAPAPAPPAAEPLAAWVAAASGRRGLIVCGPEAYGLPAEAITELAAELGWPVLADALSGLRAGRHRLGHIIDAYDPLLRSPAFAAAARPELVLRFGAAPTGRPLTEFLARSGATHSVVDAPGGWRDPDALASAVLHADPERWCRAAVAALRARRPAAFSGLAGDAARTNPQANDSAWLGLWQRANAAARDALRTAVDALAEPFEGSAPQALARVLPDGATLVVGNSMPVRDVDAFFPALARDIRLVGTRGASGIDGVVSTAVGAAAARGGPVALLIGDLSFLHDLNGLWALRRHALSLTVLLVNNNGGGIFHFLPQAEAATPDEFEQWFGTPHGLDFRHAVALHGGHYELLEGTRWDARLAAALARPGLSVLELRTERHRNVELHRQVWPQVARAADAALATAAGPR